MVRKGAPREGSEQRTDSSVHRVPLAACRGQMGEVGEKTREKTRVGFTAGGAVSCPWTSYVRP